MKFSKEHFQGLKAAIEKSSIDIAATIENYKVKGLSDTRLRWDLFWASNYCHNESFRAASYLDTHIDTALKAVVKELSN